MSGFPVAPLTSIKTDNSNSVHLSGQHVPSVPPPPYPMHPQHRMHGAYTPGSLPYSAQPSWSQDLSGYPRPSYMGSVAGRLQPGTPEGQHGYSTRHSTGTPGGFPASRLLMAGYGRAPPPPYPGHAAGYDSQRQPTPAHSSWPTSSPTVSSALSESRQLVAGSAGISISQPRAPLGQTSVQPDTANRLSYPETKPVAVSQTKRVALENKPSVPAPAVSHVNKDSPFYLVCKCINEVRSM